MYNYVLYIFTHYTSVSRAIFVPNHVNSIKKLCRARQRSAENFVCLRLIDIDCRSQMLSCWVDTRNGTGKAMAKWPWKPTWGLPKMGVPQTSSSIYSEDFPWNQPTIFRYPHDYGNQHMILRRNMVQPWEIRKSDPASTTPLTPSVWKRRAVMAVSKSSL